MSRRKVTLLVLSLLALSLVLLPALELATKAKPCWYDCGYWCLYFPCDEVPVREEGTAGAELGYETPMINPSSLPATLPVDSPLPAL